MGGGACCSRLYENTGYLSEREEVLKKKHAQITGYIYGCSGGTNTGDSGFNDVHTGTRYNYINKNQAIDTRTGQPINTPDRKRYDNIIDK